jgi:leukotriene-A4 hydrolase
VQLQATLPPSSKFNLTVRYRTSAQGSGESSFSWLTPEQTVGGRHPYVFTQAEPIYARTIFPCQDSPSVKATFECAVEVEGGLVAYVSGLKLVSSVDSVSGGTVHRFE